MPTTTSTPVNPSLVPIPLPQWQSPMAPQFDQKNPSTLCMYLLDYESPTKVAQLTLAECLAQCTHYLTEEDRTTWKSIRI